MEQLVEWTNKYAEQQRERQEQPNARISEYGCPDRIDFIG
jgi:hypothetical protein